MIVFQCISGSCQSVSNMIISERMDILVFQISGTASAPSTLQEQVRTLLFNLCCCIHISVAGGDKSGTSLNISF